jgi:hypothetical protein
MKITSIYKTFINAAIKRSFGIAKIALKYIQNSLYVFQRTFLKQGERPNAKAFGASGSQVSPDFARPAGL